MSDTKQKFYLTTPIYYVNARPHIGHAYTTIAADVIARRHRLLGDDTFFLTGTDEHGQKIERSAAAAGIPPQQFADQVSAQFESLWKRMGITNDDYIRTTEPRHKAGVQKLFQLLRDCDKIYLSTYTGQYSVGEEMFVDGPPGTIGPDGKPTETVTEENYFFRLSEYQRPLIDLIESGELDIQPEVRKNEVLSFLRGNVASVRQSESVIPSEGAAESKDLRFSAAGNPYVPGALKDLSISRSSFKWGIPVPGDEKHVIYVWLDALANYMTAIGYGSDDPADIEKFNRYWPADLHLVGKEIIRFHCVYWPAFLLAAGLPLPKAITAHGWLLFEESKMSKSRGNIVRTETILDAFGTLCPPPPPSTSPLSFRSAAEESASPTDSVKGTASAVPQKAVGEAALAAEVQSSAAEDWKHQQDLFASDVLRYFLLREIPFGQDGSFSFDALVQRYNSDLASGYGNTVSRTLSMIEKFSDCTIPLFSPDDAMNQRIESITSLFHLAEATFESNNFGQALSFVNVALSQIDSMISSNAPWKLAKSNEEKDRILLSNILFVASDGLRQITALLYPVMPYSTTRVWSQLGLDLAELTTSNQQLASLTWGGLKPGTKLGPLSPIFPRAPKELIQIMTDMEQNNAPKPEPSKLVDEKTTHTEPVVQDPTHPAAPPRTSALDEPNPGAQVGAAAHPHPDLVKTPPHAEAPASGPFAASAAASATPDTPQISIDDFVKIDLRVAKIIVAERIPKADKLLRLEVDLGYEKRQILSGIAEWYTPEELIGRNIVVIANLAPRKMRGLISHGMLLAASHGEDGKPILATFAEDIALGSRLR
ncbi:MAG TPA: methionine--tRNA ligase subunit beta [Edaphobacter sp.]|nr:methionine--tRNA ligase subunit beta [Edaphobacter sp.]